MKGQVERAVIVIILGLVLLAPATSQAAGGVRPMAVLDPSFGDLGLVRSSSESAVTAFGGATRSGNLLVSGGSGVQVLASDGGTGNAFGGFGSLRLPQAKGDEFGLGAFTIDPLGRLLVVGTSFFPETENPSPFLEDGARAFRPGIVRILRFLPDGHLDPTFGNGGVVESDLGLSPPVGIDGESLGQRPAIHAFGIAVAPEGQIVVTGGAVFRLGESCEHDSFKAVGVSAGFVARFTASGAPDPSFGSDGLVGGRQLSENALGASGIGEPIIGPRGGITYLSTGVYRCERNRSHLGVGQLTPGGQPRVAFGKRGAIVGPFSAMTSRPDGSVIALAEGYRRHENEELRARLLDIAPSGSLDSSFGQDGQAIVKFGPGRGVQVDSLTVDGQGRVLVGGTIRTGRGRSLVLLRVSGRGRWETNFGPHGLIVTRVPGLGQFGSSDLFFDPRGRLVTVHQYSRMGHYGLVVARYLLKR